MMFTEEQKDGFFEAVESLKKYRRAELIDEKGRNLLENLYTDLLPNNHILKKSLKDNTTFLIGRKGTGKSTIFLRLEQEIRKNNQYLSCYLDVKTIYESSQTDFSKIDYVEEILPAELIEKYLIERTFIQSVLSEIQKEIAIKTDGVLNNIAKHLIKTKPEVVKENLEELRMNIDNNEALKQIEIPTLKKIAVIDKKTAEISRNNEKQLGGFEATGEVKATGLSAEIKTDSALKSRDTSRNISEIQNQFSNVFLQVFQIKDVIIKVKETLQTLNIKHLVILLDDFSEIDDTAIKSFVDVILAPLNNWSEEFIKFKVAAYPYRIYYGKIDPGKIDTINLDFYNLYSEFDRNRMEEQAIDFTKRLIQKRTLHFTGNDPEPFFDVKQNSMAEYYELLFQVSMNVPRILGYILSYCYQSKTIFNKFILKSDIQAAAQRYYEEKLVPFFDTTTYSLISIDEKISILQLKDLLASIIDKSSEIKRRIQTKDLRGENYIQSEPYSSHFYFDPRLEEFLKTLELNFFISKYSDLSDRDGNPSSIYCINYGYAQKHNLFWGIPRGSVYRKYFIERPFNFNRLIKDFLTKAKKIHCINPDCYKHFTIDELKFLEFNNFKCNDCSNPVIIEAISDEIKSKLENIDRSKLLPIIELKILNELERSDDSLFAREIAEELDFSRQLVAWRCRKLDKSFGLVERYKEIDNLPYKYKITKKGKEFYFHI